MKIVIQRLPNKDHVSIVKPEKEYQSLALLSDAMTGDEEFFKQVIISLSAALACLPEESTPEILNVIKTKSEEVRHQLKIFKK